jgi:UDP-2,3-diacylglucosamine hydrolase
MILGDGRMPGTLFVSDLHLDPSRPRITRLFLDVLKTLGREADAVYLLGDLFEIWLGDDDDNPVGQAVAEGLGACTAAGTPVYLMHGNRDFLIGERFSARCGCRLLEDPARIDLYGSPAVLTHGDGLCTDDIEYQAFRSTVRDPRWQEAFLRKPLTARRTTAQALRMKSRASTRDKPETLTDVNHEAVLQLMKGHGVRLLIHGHTHRPGVHAFEIEGEPARRIVLGDWYRQGSMLECTPQDCRLRDLPLD